MEWNPLLYMFCVINNGSIAPIVHLFYVRTSIYTCFCHPLRLIPKFISINNGQSDQNTFSMEYCLIILLNSVYSLDLCFNGKLLIQRNWWKSGWSGGRLVWHPGFDEILPCIRMTETGRIFYMLVKPHCSYILPNHKKK